MSYEIIPFEKVKEGDLYAVKNSLGFGYWTVTKFRNTREEAEKEAERKRKKPKYAESGHRISAVALRRYQGWEGDWEVL